MAIKTLKNSNRNLQLLNTLYVREKWGEGGLISEDAMIINYRDLDNDKIDYMLIKSPKIDFYVAKEEPKYKMAFIEKDKVDKHRVKYRELLKYIASMAGLEDLYYQCLRSKNREKLKELHQLKYLFSSDIDIEDFTIGKFLDTFKTDESKYKITKAFYDIEVDSINVPGFADEHEALSPINMISLYLDETETMYSFILVNNKANGLPENPQIDDFVNKYEKYKNKYLEKLFKKYKIDFDPNKLIINFYEKEIDLIREFFEIINQFKPNFCMAWNARFDMQTLINRIKHHNIDPETIICHKDFPEETWVCDFYEDKKHVIHSEKGDNFNCTSYTKYLDQLIVYATLRVGIDEKESYTLNNVAKEDLDDSKLNYEEEVDIKAFPYKNFKKFVCYNIKDVDLIRRIEEKNQDISTLYALGLDTRTRIEKAMKKTISIKNMAGKFFDKFGLIIGNNFNAGRKREISNIIENMLKKGIIDTNGNYLNQDISEIERIKANFIKGKVKKCKKQPLFYNEQIYLDFGIPGGYVGDPLNNGFNGMKLLGKKSMWLYNLIIDMDLSSMYPSIINAFNLSIGTQIGKIYFTNRGYNIEVNPSGKFLSNLSDKNYTQLAQEWFNCPSVEELNKELNNNYAVAA